MPSVLLSIGSNQGDRLSGLLEVSDKLPVMAGPVTGYSSVFESEPWGFDADTQFLNQVVEVRTRLDPLGLIAVLQEIETGMGRIRQPGGYQSRTIDIDILFYDDWIIDTGNLQIPHPRLHLRRFVLEPLSEFRPAVIHPLMGLSVSQLLKDCEDKGKVRLYTHRSELGKYFRSR